MACQSAISGMFRNISQAKARALGVLPKVVATLVCMACIAVMHHLYKLPSGSESLSLNIE